MSPERGIGQTPTMGLRGLLLDFGGVIERTPFELLDDFCMRHGLGPKALPWRGPFDPQGDAIWRAQQAGDISEREYWRVRAEEVGRLFGEGWGWTDLMDALFLEAPHELLVRPEADALVKEAALVGVRTGVLSNELEAFHGQQLLARVDVLRSIDVVVDGTHTGVLKPAPGAYALAIEALAVPAANVVFLDDQLANVQGGQHAGLVGVHVDPLAPSLAFSRARALLGLDTKA